MKNTILKFRQVIVLLVFCIVLSVSSSAFLKLNNLINVLWSISTTGIIAVMATFIIINGKIDLSVGGTVALSAIVVVKLVMEQAWNIPAAIVVGLLSGAAVGAVNGLIVTCTKVPDFIATFCMSTLLTGVSQLLTGGKTVSAMSNKAYTALGNGKLWKIPYPILVFLAMFLLAWLLLNKTTFGRRCFLTGGNPLAARVSGIPTRRTIFLSYLLPGVAAAVSGVVLSALTQQATNTMGNGYEMDVIAAVVIGGTLMSGGVGSMGGTIFGVFLIGIIDNGMNLLGFPGTVEPVVKGLLIIFAVALNNYLMKKQTSAGKAAASA